MYNRRVYTQYFALNQYQSMGLHHKAITLSEAVVLLTDDFVTHRPLKRTVLRR